MSINNALLLAARELQYQQKRECWKNDIALWAKERFGLHLWSKQREIADALIKHKKVAVKSCHGSGKSFTASIVIAWWVDTRIDLDAIVVSTAPTYEQVNKILWEYLRGLMTKTDATGNPILPGKITMEDEWKDVGGRVVGFGRKPSDTNQHGFQGIHRRQGVLAVLDEACGIADSLWTGVEAITTGIHDRILAIANPDDPNTRLGKIFADPDNGWYKITISAFDTPNFTKEGAEVPDEVLGALISKDWVEEKKRDWGEESAVYQSKVKGEFPSQGVNSLFSAYTLAKGHETKIDPHEHDKPHLGVDVARFGVDYTTVYVYHSGQVRLVDKWAKTDTVTTSERVNGIARSLEVSDVRVDGVGIGAGVWDMLGRLAGNPDGTVAYKVVGMVGNNASPDIDKWFNARAWWYDTMREKMASGALDIDPEDLKLSEELGVIQYKFSNRGAIQIETKDEMLKRGVKSPDFADGACYACADLPIDPEHPLADIPYGEAFQIGLEEMLFGEDLSISPF
ncbi:MAG: hypothetical protein ACTHJ9_00670 [Rhodanobacter sp.]